MNPHICDSSATVPATSALPSPSPEELAHSARLERYIREEIAAAGGAIPFDRFMELALYAPGLGYYAAGRRLFGTHGDFVTAPELGPLFARCLARPAGALLAQLDGADILEGGAGSGVLAADLLLELETLDRLPEHYFILELSADLRARQAEILCQKAPHLCGRVRWLDELPRAFRGLVLANELLDAMPVSRFMVTESGVHELCVGWEGDGFVWRERPAGAALRDRVAALKLPAGYVSEINLRAEAWVRGVAEGLQQGALLLFDYGFPRAEFYHPQRAQGTLMCHYRHRAHGDPLRLVGLQDVTAHVDFSAIAAAGVAAGLALTGYSSQGAFLLDSGLDQIMAASDPNDVRAHLALTQQVKKLTLPHEMGELFKVIAFTRGLREALPGFTLQDRRGRL